MARPIFGWWYVLETDAGLEVVPDMADVLVAPRGSVFVPWISALHSVLAPLRSFIRGTKIYQIERREGFGIRHPTRDCWMIFGTMHEAKNYLDGPGDG